MSNMTPVNANQSTTQGTETHVDASSGTCTPTGETEPNEETDKPSDIVEPAQAGFGQFIFDVLVEKAIEPMLFPGGEPPGPTDVQPTEGRGGQGPSGAGGVGGGGEGGSSGAGGAGGGGGTEGSSGRS